MALFTLVSAGVLLGLLVIPTNDPLPALAGGGSLQAVDLSKSEAMSFAKPTFNESWFQEINEQTADGRFVTIVKFLSTDNPQTVVNFELPSLVSADYPGTTGQFGGKFASVAATLRKFVEVTPTPTATSTVTSTAPAPNDKLVEAVREMCFYRTEKGVFFNPCETSRFSALREANGTYNPMGIKYESNGRESCPGFNLSTDLLDVDYVDGKIVSFPQTVKGVCFASFRFLRIPTDTTATPTPVPTVNPTLPSFIMELVARWCPTCPLYGFSPLLEADGSISTRGVLFTANNQCYLWNIDRANVQLDFSASGKPLQAQGPVKDVNVCEFASVRVNPMLFLPAVSRQPKGRLDDPSLNQCIDTAVEINGVTGGDGAGLWSRVFSDIDRGWHYESPLPTTGMYAPKGGKTDLTNNRVATPGKEILEALQGLTWWCQSYRFSEVNR